MFTAPTPLRVGPVDVSVLLQVDHTPVLDADVRVALRAPGLDRTAAATRAAATNKLFYAALLDVPEPGRWTLEARVRAGEHAATVSCEVDVAPPLPPQWRSGRSSRCRASSSRCSRCTSGSNATSKRPEPDRDSPQRT